MSTNSYVEVIATAERLHSIASATQMQMSTTVREVATQLEAKLNELAAPIRKNLETLVEEHQRFGRPQSLLRVIGQSHLEKPFNRIMKWCADIEADHCFGTKFLEELAALAELPELAADLAAGEIPQVSAETAIDASQKMPDLVVRTTRAALMVENKVRAGESGEQYAPYLLSFTELAAGRHSRALLCARDLRETPPGWHGCITHAQLATLFERIAHLDSTPFWGRIVAWQCAAAFRDQAPEDDLREAQQLLSATATKPITPKQFRRMRELQAIQSAKATWPN